MFHRLLFLLPGILLGCKAASDKDPKCPEGFYPGIAVTEGQYTVPFERLYNLTGSFHHAYWYNQANTTNTGEDNTVGATRAGDTEGFAFKERLVRVFKDDAEAMIAYVGEIPIQFPDPSGKKVVSYPSYIEELRLISVCEGTATLVHMWVVYCADDVVHAWDGWDRYRRGAVDAIIVGEGAQDFKGTCPQALPQAWA